MGGKWNRSGLERAAIALVAVLVPATALASETVVGIGGGWGSTDKEASAQAKSNAKASAEKMAAKKCAPSGWKEISNGATFHCFPSKDGGGRWCSSSYTLIFECT